MKGCHTLAALAALLGVISNCTRTESAGSVSSDTVVAQKSPQSFSLADTVVSAAHWSFGQSSAIRTVSRFAGESKIYSSGRLVLGLDTALNRTGDALLSAARADSLIVSGVDSSERLATFCRFGSSDEHGERVGLVAGQSERTWRQPRLAWLFDSTSARIRAVRTDSTVCAVAPEGY